MKEHVGRKISFSHVSENLDIPVRMNITQLILSRKAFKFNGLVIGADVLIAEASLRGNRNDDRRVEFAYGAGFRMKGV